MPRESPIRATTIVMVSRSSISVKAAAKQEVWGESLFILRRVV
jgi:hypothetical protein